MGYTTVFSGYFETNKKLDKKLYDYLVNFSCVRHMVRDNDIIKRECPDYQDFCFRHHLGTEGEFFVKDDGLKTGVLDFNRPPCTQPGLWCHWIPDEADHSHVIWDGAEKFYDYEKWLVYLIDNFLRPNGYTLNGKVSYQGEDDFDKGYIEVKDNVVSLVPDKEVSVDENFGSVYYSSHSF